MVCFTLCFGLCSGQFKKLGTIIRFANYYFLNDYPYEYLIRFIIACHSNPPAGGEGIPIQLKKRFLARASLRNDKFFLIIIGRYTDITAVRDL